MNELHRATDKFEEANRRLETVLGRIDPNNPDEVGLALAEAKRVRRESNILVRALARLRDQLQP